jgi:hypothetical protein
VSLDRKLGFEKPAQAQSKSRSVGV